MDWVFAKRRGPPEWKQGWRSQGLVSVSAPPLSLLPIFCIVILLLSLSHYNTYKDQLRKLKINFQLLFLFLVPALFIFFIRSSLDNNKFNFWAARPRKYTAPHTAPPGGNFAWGVALLLVLLLLLVSYQSSFQSQWFGPLGKSN